MSDSGGDGKDLGGANAEQLAPPRTTYNLHIKPTYVIVTVPQPVMSYFHLTSPIKEHLNM